MIGGRKISGVLCEAIHAEGLKPSVVMGIGLNVNQIAFTPELSSSATSLSLVTGKIFDRVKVLCTLLERMEELYNLIQTQQLGAILERWKRWSSMLGKRISVRQNGNIFHGIARDLSDDGALIIQIEDREMRILAGDVTIIHE